MASKYSQRLLDAATATGEGAAFETGKPLSTHTVAVKTTGAPTAVVIDLEGSLDDITYHQLAQHTFIAAEITAEAAMFHVSNKPVNYVRANLITLTAGTAPTVTVEYKSLQGMD